MVDMKVQRVGCAQAEALGALLAERHRAHSPFGATHVLADDATALAMVTATLEDGAAYAALEGRDLVGFMVVPPPSMPGSTSARLGMTYHAARADHARSAYRALYQAASADLVAAGTTYHSLPVLVEHATAVDTFFELELGVDQIDGLLSLQGRATVGPTAALRPAAADDLDRVLELAIELQRFHTRAPTFEAAAHFDALSMRRNGEAAIEDDRALVVVLEGDDRLLGMAAAGPASAYVDTVDIGMNIITDGARSRGLGTGMLNYVLDWATAKQYRFCTVGWKSSNLVSDAFYRSRGFSPVRLRLHRRIDSRILDTTDTLGD